MPKIKSDSALPKVVEYLDNRRDSFYSAIYLLNRISFDPKKDGINGEYSHIGGKHFSRNTRALSHALTLGIGYNHEALDHVSQLRIWNMTGNSIYGVYYGVIEGKKPQEITATHDPKSRTEFYLNAGHPNGHVSDVRRTKRVIPRRVAPKQ